jgi:hypothetical protein
MGQACCSVPVGNGLKPFPTKDCLHERQVKGSRVPPKRGFADSTSIYLPAEASAQAGQFLSNLKKMTFHHPVIFNHFLSSES